MSQENVDLHYRVMDAYNWRDLDQPILALMDDDSVEGIPRIARHRGQLLLRARRNAALVDGPARHLARLHSIEISTSKCAILETCPRSQPCALAARAQVVALPSMRRHGRSPGGGAGNASCCACSTAGRSPRSRGAVGARRSRRLLTLCMTTTVDTSEPDAGWQVYPEQRRNGSCYSTAESRPGTRRNQWNNHIQLGAASPVGRPSQA